MIRRSMVASVLAVCVLAGCSDKKDAPAQARFAPQNDAERKAVADLARKAADANAAVDARKNAAARPRKALAGFEGSWTSVRPFADGRMRISVGRDGAIVAETVTRGGATSASAIGTLAIDGSGTAKGTLSRPYGALAPFAKLTVTAGPKGRIFVSGSDSRVELIPERT